MYCCFCDRILPFERPSEACKIWRRTVDISFDSVLPHAWLRHCIRSRWLGEGQLCRVRPGHVYSCLLVPYPHGHHSHVCFSSQGPGSTCLSLFLSGEPLWGWLWLRTAKGEKKLPAELDWVDCRQELPKSHFSWTKPHSLSNIPVY